MVLYIFVDSFITSYQYDLGNFIAGVDIRSFHSSVNKESPLYKTQLAWGVAIGVLYFPIQSQERRK